ncbi:MAG: hypothetical protein WB628_11960 [Candidatus Sulfotelmatobacter sp.]
MQKIAASRARTIFDADQTPKCARSQDRKPAAIRQTPNKELAPPPGKSTAQAPGIRVSTLVWIDTFVQ